jgi:hypothetical protein
MSTNSYFEWNFIANIIQSKLNLRMQFKHPEILYFLFLLIVPLLVHLFQFRRFIFTNVRFSRHFLCRPEALKKKNGCYLADYYCYPYYHRFAQPYFAAKTKRMQQMKCILS